MALTPVCSVPKLRDSPENMRCLERSFSTIALQALSHLRAPGEELDPTTGKRDSSTAQTKKVAVTHHQPQPTTGSEHTQLGPKELRHSTGSDKPK